jgi:DNA invertase Pin-like site-specific DNA recombinase
MMVIGCARVSSGEQNLDIQIDALRQAGCEQVFTDEVSGAISERPGLQEAPEFLRQDNPLVVWRLDRLGWSLKDLVQRVEEL